MTGKKYLSLEMFMTWLEMILGISKPKTHTLGCVQVIPAIFPYKKMFKIIHKCCALSIC